MQTAYNDKLVLRITRFLQNINFFSLYGFLKNGFTLFTIHFRY